MDALLTVIVTWLAMATGLPADYHHPTIKFTTSNAMYLVRYGVTDTGAGPHVIAVYDTSSDTILLSQGWQADSPADVSALVHEMVHHLQTRAGSTYACGEAREAPAYAAQDKWLIAFGSNLEQQFGINAFTLKLMTICDLP